MLVRETIDNCLREAMDLDGLLEVLRAVESGAIRTVAIDTPEPSAFCHEILNANPYAYLDDAPLEERRARAVQLRRTLRDDVDGAGVLDPAAIARSRRGVVAGRARRRRAARRARRRSSSLPPVARVAGVVRRARRAAARDDAARDGARLWACAERLELARLAYPGVASSRTIAQCRRAGAEGARRAFTEIVRGWLESSGPTTVARIAERLGCGAGTVEAALLRARSAGASAARTLPGDADEEWCNRRVLARIHRLDDRYAAARDRAGERGAIRHASLQRWQHVAPAARLHGVDGTLQVVRQLEGYEIPAAAWETYLARAGRGLQARIPRPALLLRAK